MYVKGTKNELGSTLGDSSASNKTVKCGVAEFKMGETSTSHEPHSKSIITLMRQKNSRIGEPQKMNTRQRRQISVCKLIATVFFLRCVRNNSHWLSWNGRNIGEDYATLLQHSIDEIKK